MRIKFKKRFTKLLDKSPSKIQNAFYEKLKIFLNEPYHPTLNNHQLRGKLREFRSFNITGDWRVMFKEFEDEDLVVFYILGAHSELYKQ